MFVPLSFTLKSFGGLFAWKQITIKKVNGVLYLNKRRKAPSCFHSAGFSHPNLEKISPCLCWASFGLSGLSPSWSPEQDKSCRGFPLQVFVE